MKKFWIMALLCALALPACSGSDSENEGPSPENSERYYVNKFAYNMMNQFYLWRVEISSALNSWRTDDDPIQKVKSIRYKKPSGEDIDKWTVMTDDYASMVSSVQGNSKSMGFDFNLYYMDSSKKTVCAVVTYVDKDGPAEEAGLKRGDTIVEFDGKTMTIDNYNSLLSSTILGGGTCTFALYNGGNVTLTARQMYHDPVNVVKVIDHDGRRYGYIHYTSFTQESCPALVETFEMFKAEGIQDLILDLRYNGGGYTLTGELLASMIAPSAAVQAGELYMTAVYNDILQETWADESNTFFTTDFTYTTSSGSSRKISTASANPDVENLYVIYTGNSASASESLVCGLLPFLPVKIFGEQSSGKYCEGIIVDGPTWYGWLKDDLSVDEYRNGVNYSNNWGIYVMIGRYADKNGFTHCMPDGFAPDVKVTDDPLDGYQLGDEEETMLWSVLNGRAKPAATTRAAARPEKGPSLSRPSFNVRTIEGLK